MGGIIPLEDGQKLDTVRVKASIADPDGEELGKVEVIGANGITVKTFEISGSTYELDAELPNTEPYYYLKVTQADGDIAVTAPVWVGEATPITADLKNSTALSTVGTSETITSTITNAATANYQISKVELTVTAGGTTTTVETQTPAKTLAPDQKETFSFTFKPTAAGAQTLRAHSKGSIKPFGRRCVVGRNDRQRGDGDCDQLLPDGLLRGFLGQRRPGIERTGGFVGGIARCLSGALLPLGRCETDVVVVMVMRRDGGRQQHEYRRYQE